MNVLIQKSQDINKNLLPTGIQKRAITTRFCRQGCAQRPGNGKVYPRKNGFKKVS